MILYKKVLFAVLFSVGISIGQPIEDGFNIYFPPDDTTRQVFLPYFRATEIGTDYFVSIDEQGHFTYDGEPVRFFGVNLVADGAFPVKEKSWFIAGHLRKMGINLIRFHHMDNPWSEESIFYQQGSTRILNTGTLDRFEYLVNELKNNGIFINFNLHVSRTFRTADGVTDADSIKNYGKGVTYFDPHLIMLQKEYAAQMLNHINPYTNMTLSDDPVMAMVEIINENSLYRMWRDDKLKHFSDGGDLTMRHSLMLDSLWHDYLKEKYDNTNNLATAWNENMRPGGEDEQIPDPGFEEGKLLQNWIMEQHESATAIMAVEENSAYSGMRSARVEVTNGDGTDWHIQWKKTGLTLKKDSLYTVRFAARTNIPRSIDVSVMKDSDPWTGYKSASFYITNQWQEYSFTLTAPIDLNNGARLSFHMGKSSGNFWFDDMGFHASPIVGLTDGESLENNSVIRMDFSKSSMYSDNRIRDISRFYLKIQDDFLADMYDYLKNDIGIKVPMVGTNWNVGAGDMASQSKLDYIDNHSYWDHPSFPNEPWSPTDWTIRNTPMVKDPDGGTITGLMAGVGNKGKPYTISEYNHSFPNRYQSEGMLFITAYASLHDVDGIMFFDYGGSSTDWESDFIGGYFSIHRNPAMMSLTPSCALAYRENYISRSNNFLEINYSEDDILLLPKYDAGGWISPAFFPNTLALEHGIRTASFSADTPFDPDMLPPAPSQPYTTDTGEIIWKTSGLMTTAADKFVGITGFLSQHRGSIAGLHRLLDGSEFATFTWVSLDKKNLTSAQYSLMTLSSRTGNSGMVWDGTTTVHNNWGTSPTLMDRAFITIQVDIKADSIKIYPLTELGSVSQYSTTYYPGSDNKFVVRLDQDLDQTTWFGVESFGSVVSVPIESQNDLPKSYQLNQNYPNPFNPVTNIRYALPKTSEVEIHIYNTLGQQLKVINQGVKSAGWYDLQIDMTEFASGLYYYQIKTDNFVQTRKMVLMK